MNLDISKSTNPDPIVAKFLENVDPSSKNYFTLPRPTMFQIIKTYNVSQPKISQKSHSSSRLLKLTLQEAGGAKICAIEYEFLGNKLNIDTPSGSKIELRGRILYLNGYLLLMNDNFRFLGGRVKELYQNWWQQRQYEEMNAISDTGSRVISKAPMWVPFQGSKNARQKKEEIEKLGQKKTREVDEGLGDEDEEFKKERDEILAEVKTKKKIFVRLNVGGGGGDDSYRDDRQRNNTENSQNKEISQNIQISHQASRGGGRGRSRGGRGRGKGRGKRGENDGDNFDDSDKYTLKPNSGGSSIAGALFGTFADLKISEPKKQETFASDQMSHSAHQSNYNYSHGRENNRSHRGGNRGDSGSRGHSGNRGGNGNRGASTHRGSNRNNYNNETPSNNYRNKPDTRNSNFNGQNYDTSQNQNYNSQNNYSHQSFGNNSQDARINPPEPSYSNNSRGNSRGRGQPRGGRGGRGGNSRGSRGRGRGRGRGY